MGVCVCVCVAYRQNTSGSQNREKKANRMLCSVSAVCCSARYDWLAETSLEDYVHAQHYLLLNY